MSDTTDESDAGVEDLVAEADARSVREWMRAFVTDHGEPADPKALRERVASGTDVSDLVVEERDERV